MREREDRLHASPTTRPHAMKKHVVILFGLAAFLLPERAAAQSFEVWWSWALPTVQAEQARHYDERRHETQRPHRSRRAHPGRGVRVPPGHLPPPGECRLWYYDRPPGQQPPPVPCGELSARRYRAAAVVTHQGVVERPRESRARSRRTEWEVVVWGDIVFRRGARQPTGEIIGSAGIEMILGRSVVDRLRRHRGHGEGRVSLQGRWIDVDRRGRALQVQAGDVPLAEFSDVDGDGRVDATLLHAEGR